MQNSWNATLMLVSALAFAGCGDDSSDDDTGGGTVSTTTAGTTAGTTETSGDESTTSDASTTSTSSDSTTADSTTTTDPTATTADTSGGSSGGAGGGCGWGPTMFGDAYSCGGNGEDPSGTNPIACPAVLGEMGDPCGDVTPFGCCDGDTVYNCGGGSLFVEDCSM